MNTNIPFQSQQPIFGKVGNIAELVRMTAEERKKYNISIDSYRTNLSVMKNERAEGNIEGIEKERIRNITNMRSKGLADEFIADLLDLDIEYVRAH